MATHYQCCVTSMRSLMCFSVQKLKEYIEIRIYPEREQNGVWMRTDCWVECDMGTSTNLLYFR